MQTNPLSGTWTEAEDLPDWTESDPGWALCAGAAADFQLELWRAGGDGWSLSDERMTEHRGAAVASAGPLLDPGTEDLGDPRPEEGLQRKASLHLPATWRKRAVRGNVEAWPGSPGHTEGKTECKVRPPVEGLLQRRWLTSSGCSVRRDAQDAGPQLDL